MENKNLENKLSPGIIEIVEWDLRRYPDWLIRTETAGLGTPSRSSVECTKNMPHGSSVEEEYLQFEEINRKVETINRVYSRLRGNMQDIIELRYFQRYSRDDILTMKKIYKTKYYRLRNMALEMFARALGYIE